MKPRIVISMGDFNGIGPEVTLKALLSPGMRRLCHPVLIGSLDVYEHYAIRLGLSIDLREIDSLPERFDEHAIYVLSVRKYSKPRIQPGRESVEAGMYAGEAIETAAELCRHRSADGMVTAPVSKKTMNDAGYRTPGQTEMLARICGVQKVGMMLIAGDMRVGLATAHTSIRTVAGQLSKSSILQRISIYAESLRKDFAIRSPKIAVLALNPHAGEDGLLGNEEKKIITPAIDDATRAGIRAFGPFSADGFFGTHAYAKFDAVLAMYHDQGLIPLKMRGFDIGVNYSAGLPIVRTSPDHGTAFDIAARGTASPASMVEAIRLAAAIIRIRRRH